MAIDWAHKDLLGLEALTASEIEAVLDAAEARFKAPQARLKTLQGRFAAFLFTEASTRTRNSFEVALRRLGADVLGFSAAGSSLLKGETLLDTVKNLDAMGVEYFIARNETSGSMEALAAACKASFINAGDGAHEHPTQALLDLFTLRRRKGKIKGLRVVIVGDILHSRVARSNIHGLRKLGARVTVCGPSSLIPQGIERLGAQVSHDLDEALKGADAVNVLRLQLERQQQNFVTSLADYSLAYGITAERLSAHKDCLLLHPGPINRGVELSGEAADSDQSAILEQVTAGVAVRMAVLELLENWRARHAR